MGMKVKQKYKPLPPLAIYMVGGGTVRKMELPDPRAAMVEKLNQLGAATGLKAVIQKPRRSA